MRERFVPPYKQRRLDREERQTREELEFAEIDELIATMFRDEFARNAAYRLRLAPSVDSLH